MAAEYREQGHASCQSHAQSLVLLTSLCNAKLMLSLCGRLVLPPLLFLPSLLVLIDDFVFRALPSVPSLAMFPRHFIMINVFV